MTEQTVQINKRSPLRLLNIFLAATVALLSLYIMLGPLLPNIDLWWGNHFGSKPPLVLANSPDHDKQVKESVPTENTLVIPKISMQEIVYDGASIATLRKGIWHRPASSSPDRGSNTVLVGHRFTYNGPAVFYHLDKLETGDDIFLYWNQKKITYKVTKVYVVAANHLGIEAPSDGEKLTIYTCTPLLTAKDRLVVEAEPIGENR